MSDISIECYECGAVYRIEEDYNSGSTRVVKVVPHKCDGDVSSVVSELKIQILSDYRNLLSVAQLELLRVQLNLLVDAALER